MNILRIILITILFLAVASCSTTSLNQEESKQIKPSSPKLSTLKTKQPISNEFFHRQLYIVALGDSLTTGIGDTTNNKGYLAYIHQKLANNPLVEFHITNYGISGLTTNDLLHKITEEEVVDDLRKAELILLTIGGNDLLKVVIDNFPDITTEVFIDPQQMYENNLISILNFIRTHNAKAHIMIIGLYNPFYKWFSSVNEINDIIISWNGNSENIAATFKNTHLIKIDDIFRDLQADLLYEDQFHPNSNGYHLIGKRVYEVLRAELHLH